MRNAMSESIEQIRIASKRFKVVAISDNTNSFGLNRFVLIARDGETWIGHKAKQYALLKLGQVTLLETPVDHALAKLGFEITERIIPDCPPKAMNEAWEPSGPQFDA